MQRVGDRAAEEAPGVAVDDVQRRDGVIHRRIALHEEVDVQHEHLFLLRLAGLVVDLAQHSRAAFDVALCAAGHGRRDILLVFEESALLRVVVAHQAEIARLDQLAPLRILQAQLRLAEGVDIPQADTREIRGLICLNERGEDAVEPLGEFLPAGIAVRRKGNKALGQADLPLAVGGDELIVVDRPLRRQLSARLLRRELLDLLRILRVFAADGILKRIRLLRLDFQNVRKPELANDLDQLIFS